MFVLIFKILGAGMIMAAAFLISRQLSESLKNRVRFIDGLLSGFVSAEEHICGMLKPVVESLECAANDAGAASSVFLSSASGGGTLRERFALALSDADKEDAEAVLQYVSGICASDEAERRTAFSLIRNRLLKQREKAENDCSRLCRLYNAAGILTGLIVIILLL